MDNLEEQHTAPASQAEPSQAFGSEHTQDLPTATTTTMAQQGNDQQDGNPAFDNSTTLWMGDVRLGAWW